jgi:hypothetical protein
MNNAKAMGYMVDENNGYKPFPVKQVTVTSSITNLAEWARQNGTTYKMLKLLNPTLRSKSLTVAGGKSFIINLPADR